MTVDENVNKSADGEAAEPLRPKMYTLEKNTRASCQEKTTEWLREKVPILSWITEYNPEFAISDFISGITLGLTIIPESIACALLAGLPPHYGLCSVFIGSFIYLIFGTISTVIIGPTSLVALVSVQFTMGKPIEMAFLLTFLAGIVELVMGTLRLGFIFEFISMPVIKAFSTATAILVIESQMKVLLGIKYLVPGFIESIRTLTYRIGEAQMGDLAMGVFAIGFLAGLEYLGNLKIRQSRKHSKFWTTFLRYLGLSRNTLIVIITGLIAAVWTSKLPADGKLPFLLSKNAMSGLPTFMFPSFTIETPEKTYTFWDILNELKFGMFVIPVIGILTNISVGKLNPTGLVKSNQELFTLGLCNVIGSGVQSMPVSGAFSRSAISTASGIKTPMANLYSGLIVILALSFLSPYFNYIPESTLAAILICALKALLDFKLPVRLWNDCKRDFATWIICFVTCVLYGVEVGLFVGIAVTALHLLFLWARPEIIIKIDQLADMQYLSVSPQNAVYFPAIKYLRERTMKACIQADFQIPVVIDCHKVTGFDYTAAQGITKMANDIAQNSQNQSSLVLFQLNVSFQKFIDVEGNLVFCESEEKLKEILTQESLKNGWIVLKDHIRASIDLGYKIEME